MLERVQNTANKKIGRILFIGGFMSALTAYNYELWGLHEQSFFHFIALAFVLYILESWITETNKAWMVIKGFVLITAISALKDEALGEGAMYKFAEYLAHTIIAIITALRIINLHYNKNKE